MRRAMSGLIGVAMVMAAAALADTMVPDLDTMSTGPLRSSAPTNPAPSDVASPGATMSGQTANAPRCTIASITENATTSDTYLSRTTFPVPDAPAGAAPVCPPGAAEAATQRALDACKQRAVNPYDCVHADTDHMFDVSTDIVDSAPLASQCFSHTSKFIAIACRAGSQQDDCNVACGATAAAATAAARSRCRANHDGDCGLINAVPVQAP
jgi:hypothetical protein